MFHFPVFSSWRSELFQNCIHSSPSKTWEFHFQISWAESSFSPSFSKWIYLHASSCDMTSVPYPQVVKSLDTLCPPHLTHGGVITLLLGSRRGARTWAGASETPLAVASSTVHLRFLSLSFPIWKMGNSKPAYLLVSSRGSDEITHVKTPQ